MSELLCTYTLTSSNTVGYFLVDRNVNYRQFVRFISNQLNLDNFVISSSEGTPVTNDAELTALYNDEFAINISPKVEAPVEEKPVPEPVVEEQPKEEPKPEPESPKFELGDTIKSILARFNIDSSKVEDPATVIERLPLPFQMMARAHISQVKAKPEDLEKSVKHVAVLFNVSEEKLLAEVKDIMQYLASLGEEAPKEPQMPQMPQMPRPRVFVRPFHCRKRPAWCSPPAPAPEEAKSEEAKPVIHHATCDNCNARIIGIRYKCLQCPDYDLCEACEEVNAKSQFHDTEHVFAKLYKASPFPARCAPFAPSFARGGMFHKRMHEGRTFPRVEKLESDVKQLQEQLAKLLADSTD